MTMDKFMWNKLARKSVKWFASREDMPAQRTVARLQEFLFDRAYPVSGAPRQHNLPHELIVSLTSYPRRYPTLDFTLRSLLDQVVNRIKSYLGHGCRHILPSRCSAESAGNRNQNMF